MSNWIYLDLVLISTLTVNFQFHEKHFKEYLPHFKIPSINLKVSNRSI